MKSLRLLLIAAALFAAGQAGAAAPAAINLCQQYGFSPHTRAYAACRMNVRHYWSTGPCTDSRFAAIHLRYCNVVPTLDF
jgi:hypothetical protein